MIEHEDHDLIFVIPFLTDVKLIQKMFYFLKNSMQKYVWFIAINCFAHKLVFSFGHPILQQSMSTQQLSLIPIFRSMKSNTLDTYSPPEFIPQPLDLEILFIFQTFYILNLERAKDFSLSKESQRYLL